MESVISHNPMGILGLLSFTKCEVKLMITLKKHTIRTVFESWTDLGETKKKGE
jgi:hypothetical protein